MPISNFFISTNKKHEGEGELGVGLTCILKNTIRIEDMYM